MVMKACHVRCQNVANFARSQHAKCWLLCPYFGYVAQQSQLSWALSCSGTKIQFLWKEMHLVIGAVCGRILAWFFVVLKVIARVYISVNLTVRCLYTAHQTGRQMDYIDVDNPLRVRLPGGNRKAFYQAVPSLFKQS